MAKTFNTYVNVFTDETNANYETFAPGDEVPDWALDRVGSHVYEDSDEGTDVRLTDPHYEPDQDVVGFTTPTTLPPVVGGVSEAEADVEDVDYSDLKKDELIALAEERGLDSSGTKAEIIERLEADDEEE